MQSRIYQSPLNVAFPSDQVPIVHNRHSSSNFYLSPSCSFFNLDPSILNYKLFTLFLNKFMLLSRYNILIIHRVLDYLIVINCLKRALSIFCSIGKRVYDLISTFFHKVEIREMFLACFVCYY